MGITYSLAIDPLGAYLYMADNAYHIIRRVSLSTGIISTAINASSNIAQPQGLIFDAAGNLFISGSGNHKVFMWNASTSAISLVAGTGTNSFSGDFGAAASATLKNPSGLAIYLNALYICDSGNNRVRKVDFSTNIITTVVGGGPHGDGQVATDASLNNPRSVLLDLSGNLFIIDEGGSKIRRVDAVTRIISTYAGTGQGGFTGKISDP